jgi:hypothetical protein
MTYTATGTVMLSNAITGLQFITVTSRLFGPIAYTLQALVAQNVRTSFLANMMIIGFYLAGMAMFFTTRYFGEKQQRFTVPSNTQRLVTNSLFTALLVLLLCDVCNYQKVILLCLLMCGSIQQKKSSALRFENRVLVLHCIPVTLMWIHSNRGIFENETGSSNDWPNSDSTTEQPGIATLFAVFCVAILATAQSHDALVQNAVQALHRTALICLVLHLVFVSSFLYLNVVFQKFSVLQTPETQEDSLWTSSDLAITSTICVMLTAPSAYDTGKWLYESIFTQVWFTLVVLLIHWYVCKNDLLPTVLALSTVQLVSNICMSSKKNTIWD